MDLDTVRILAWELKPGLTDVKYRKRIIDHLYIALTGDTILNGEVLKYDNTAINTTWKKLRDKTISHLPTIEEARGLQV